MADEHPSRQSGSAASSAEPGATDSDATQSDATKAASDTDLGKRLHLCGGFERQEERTYLEIQRAAGLLLQGFTRLLRDQAPGPRGVTASQYNVLRILRGSHPVGLTCGEIAARLLTPAPDVTRLLDRLEERGWLGRTRGDDDRRIVRSHLSEQGRAIVDALDQPVRRWVHDTLGHLRDHEQARLWELLERARAPLEAD